PLRHVVEKTEPHIRTGEESRLLDTCLGPEHGAQFFEHTPKRPVVAARRQLTDDLRPGPIRRRSVILSTRAARRLEAARRRAREQLIEQASLANPRFATDQE